jgi:hypothetical protein
MHFGTVDLSFDIAQLVFVSAFSPIATPKALAILVIIACLHYSYFPVIPRLIFIPA